MTRTIDLVGPKGYSHGWVFHGVPGVTSHSDLLKMRTEARAAHPQGHPERLKAERAVRESRKLKGATAKATGDRGEPTRAMRQSRGSQSRESSEQLGASSIAAYKRRRNAEETKREQRARDLLEGNFRSGEGEMLTGQPALKRGRGVTTQTLADEESKRQHEAMYRKYPGLSWDSFEQNSVEQGNREGSGEYHREVLRQARAQLEERQAKPEHVNRTVRARGRTRAQIAEQRTFRQTNPGESPNPLQRRFTSSGGSQAIGTTTTNTSQIANELLRIQKEQGTPAAQAALMDVMGQMLGGGRRRGRRRSFSRVALSAETPALVATPAPLGKPGGPGLYNLKGAKLPNYIENMRNALMRGGMQEGRATATAISRCKVLALTSKHPEVKAAAAAAIAELKATAARAKAVHGHSQERRAVELFNQFHLPAGAGGGRFTTKAGAGGAASARPKSTARPGAQKGPKFGPGGQNLTARAQQKAALLKQAAQLRKVIASEQVTLGGLLSQRSALQVSVGGSKAKGTTKAKKATKTATAKSKTTTKTAAGKTTARKTTQAAAKKAAIVNQIGQLGVRISQLQNTIAGQQVHVRQLVAKARSL